MLETRRATAGDAGSVARLVGELRVLEGLDYGVSEATVRSYLEAEDRVVVLAVGGGAPVGMASIAVIADLFHDGTSALVQELVVAEAHRGTGVGGALLDAAIGYARDRGCAEISVSTGADNDAALALYSSRGFEDEGVLLELHLT